MLKEWRQVKSSYGTTSSRITFTLKESQKEKTERKGQKKILEAVTTENFHEIKGKKEGRVKFRIFHRVTRERITLPSAQYNSLAPFSPLAFTTI